MSLAYRTNASDFLTEILDKHSQDGVLPIHITFTWISSGRICFFLLDTFSILCSRIFSIRNMSISLTASCKLWKDFHPLAYQGVHLDTWTIYGLWGLRTWRLYNVTAEPSWLSTLYGPNLRPVDKSPGPSVMILIVRVPITQVGKQYIVSHHDVHYSPSQRMFCLRIHLLESC